MSSPATSPARSAAARANGAKSKGPITPEGRAISSQNAVSHGLSARTVTLHGEDAAAFEQLRASYLGRFQPADQPEFDIVEAMALSQWRLRRIAMLEIEVFENTHFLNQARITDQLDDDNPFNARMGWVFMEAAKGKSLPLLLRYEGQLTRTYERSLKALQTLQKARAAQPVERTRHELQNEPKPATSATRATPWTPPEPPPTQHWIDPQSPAIPPNPALTNPGHYPSNSLLEPAAA